MIDAYLGRLGLPREEPSVDYLFALHRAHVSRVTYTNLQIMRGAPAGIEPRVSAREIIEGRGGYCFHLNGAFSWLLRELGFSVTLHRGYVMPRDATEGLLNHLVLLVHDLDGVWFVDGGLGDAIYEPLPLAVGTYEQGPFRYELTAARGRDGWRFEHDEMGSFGSMEFESAGATIADFADAHLRLSTSSESSFVNFVTAQRRLADRVETVRSCGLTVLDAAGKHKTSLETASQWCETLVRLGLSAEGLDGLWPAERARYEAWLAKA
ncbi:MAG TPA: arylamine N-acetyltransferase [Micromonosporaceae bacterium]|nr:arylamine N-acetyltransferase [Micromonosporaceae bacterium]